MQAGGEGRKKETGQMNRRPLYRIDISSEPAEPSAEEKGKGKGKAKDTSLPEPEATVDEDDEDPDDLIIRQPRKRTKVDYSSVRHTLLFLDALQPMEEQTCSANTRPLLSKRLDSRPERTMRRTRTMRSTLASRLTRTKVGQVFRGH